MRVDADGCVDGGMTIGEADAGFQVGGTVAASDRKHVFDTGGEGAFDHRFPVAIKLFAVQVTVRVDQFHVILGERRWGRLRETAPALPMSSPRWSLRSARTY